MTSDSSREPAMKTGNTFWLPAIVMTLGLLATGCAQLSRQREPEPLPREVGDKASGNWDMGRRPDSQGAGSSAEKKHPFYVNPKKLEIEKSLGL